MIPADLPEWVEGLEAAKASVAIEVTVAAPPELVPDPEHVQHVGGLRSALRTGTQAYGTNRRTRLERTNP